MDRREGGNTLNLENSTRVGMADCQGEEEKRGSHSMLGVLPIQSSRVFWLICLEIQKGYGEGGSTKLTSTRRIPAKWVGCKAGLRGSPWE